jgi:transposase
MAMGRRKTRQEEFWVATADLAKSPGHPFYDRLNKLLVEHNFDRFAEGLCEKFYAKVMGRPSIAPGAYFRCLLIGYFEGLDSERGIDWRCADSLSLRRFLGCGPDETTPDHSSISRTRRLIDLETHRDVFAWIQRLLAEHGLIKGNRIGIDASTMEANAAMRSIVRNDTHESYQEFLTKLAQASGIETPTREELIKLDRQRKDKKVGNDDWHNPYDPDAKIAKMKDGRTHLAYKNEHAVDLDTGAVIAAEIHPADLGDTTTMWGTLERASDAIQTLSEDETVGQKVAIHAKLEAVLDKGYHSNETVVELERTGVRGYIAEPDHGRRDWRDKNPKDGVDRREAQSAVYRNRRRMRGAYGKRLHRKRGELVERTFAHTLDTGGMRRAWLKGKENLHKRYLIHVGGFNLSLIMRTLTGHGTPRQWAGAFLRFLERCLATYTVCTRPRNVTRAVYGFRHVLATRAAIGGLIACGY